ncbi:MAG: hypothetical protein IPL11_14675 [Candidatus Accumulibacter sp.]|nr:hypothetical protein [Accumulibacter sp.]
MRLENQNLTPVERGLTRDIDTLVHLGAGQCSELDSYLALKAGKIILVEADSQIAAALQARTASLPNVRVMCTAVAGSAGPAVFHRYNLPGTGSLRPATGLLQLFPGLKPLDQMPIAAVLPATVLEPLQLAAEGEKLLIIDLPGEELPVLQALWEATQLQLFSQVKLRCGREPLYEGGESAARILRWLEEHGFDLLAEDDSEDPDCPCWTLQRNALQLRNLELAQQLAGLQEQLKQSSQIREAQIEKLVEQQKLSGSPRKEQEKLATADSATSGAGHQAKAARKSSGRTAGADSAAHPGAGRAGQAGR